MKFARALLTLLAIALPGLAAAAPADGVELLVFAPSLNRLVAYGVMNGSELKLTVNSYNGKVSGVLIAGNTIPLSGSLIGGQLLLVGPNGGLKDVTSFLAAYGIRAKVAVSRLNSKDAVANGSQSAPVTPASPAVTPASPAAAPASSAGNGKADAPGQQKKTETPAGGKTPPGQEKPDKPEQKPDSPNAKASPGTGDANSASNQTPPGQEKKPVGGGKGNNK